MIQNLFRTLLIFVAVCVVILLVPYWLPLAFPVLMGGGLGAMIGGTSEDGLRIGQPIRVIMLVIFLGLVTGLKPVFDLLTQKVNESVAIFHFPGIFPESTLWVVGLISTIICFCFYEGLLPGEEKLTT